MIKKMVHKMWICRDLDGNLTLHYEKPTWYDRIETWSDITLEMNPFLFPDVTFEKSPMKIELKLINNDDE